MKQRRGLKIFLSWIMLAIMAYNMLGGIFVFELANVFNREKIKSILNDTNREHFELIKVSVISSVIRIGNDEIIFEGKHYDVKKEVVENGYTCFYCIHDYDEEDLYTGLSISVSADSGILPGNNYIHTHRVVKNYAQDFFFHPSIEKMVVRTIVQRILNINEPFSSIGFSGVNTPPPKAAVTQNFVSVLS